MKTQRRKVREETRTGSQIEYRWRLQIGRIRKSLYEWAERMEACVHCESCRAFTGNRRDSQVDVGAGRRTAGKTAVRRSQRSGHGSEDETTWIGFQSCYCSPASSHSLCHSLPSKRHSAYCPRTRTARTREGGKLDRLSESGPKEGHTAWI